MTTKARRFTDINQLHDFILKDKLQLQRGSKNISCFFFSFFLRWSFTLIAQGGVQWQGICSLQPPPPRFKRFSCLNLPSS